MNGNFRNFAIWLVILFMLMGLFQVFQSSTRSTSIAEKSYSQFVTDIESGRVTNVTITNNVVSGVLNDGSRFETIIPDGADVITQARRSRREHHGARPRVEPLLVDPAVFLAAVPRHHRRVVLLHPPDAGRWSWRRDGLSASHAPSC
jgi:ATP-dependent Zn protease